MIDALVVLARVVHVLGLEQDLGRGVGGGAEPEATAAPAQAAGTDLALRPHDRPRIVSPAPLTASSPPVGPGPPRGWGLANQS